MAITEERWPYSGELKSQVSPMLEGLKNAGIGGRSVMGIGRRRMKTSVTTAAQERDIARTALMGQSLRDYDKAGTAIAQGYDDALKAYEDSGLMKDINSLIASAGAGVQTALNEYRTLVEEGIIPDVEEAVGLSVDAIEEGSLFAIEAINNAFGEAKLAIDEYATYAEDPTSHFQYFGLIESAVDDLSQSTRAMGQQYGWSPNVLQQMGHQATAELLEYGGQLVEKAAGEALDARKGIMQARAEIAGERGKSLADVGKWSGLGEADVRMSGAGLTTQARTRLGEATVNAPLEAARLKLAGIGEKRGVMGEIAGLQERKGLETSRLLQDKAGTYKGWAETLTPTKIGNTTPYVVGGSAKDKAATSLMNAKTDALRSKLAGVSLSPS